MSELPNGWIEVSLLEFIQYLPTGVPHYTGEKEYYSTGSIQNSNYSPEGIFTFENRPSRANRLSKIGDVLQARMKGTDKGLMVEERLNEKLFSTGFIQLRPYQYTYENKLLYYYVKSKIFIDQKDELATGSTQEALTDAKAKELKIIVPPFNEQKRIVEKLNKLLASVEESKARLDKIPVIIKRFRQSVLNAAVTGELTKDLRERNLEVENTQQLFVRITEVRAKRHQQEIEAAKKEKRKPVSYRKLIPNLGKDFETFEIPKNWEWVDLNFLMDETKPFCYGVVQPGTDLSTGNFLIRAGDLQNNTVHLSYLRKISSQIDLKYKRSKLKGGELLITVVGAGIGEVAIAPTECRGYNIARAVAKIPIKDFSTEYILLWLNSSSAYKWLKSSAREVARPTLNLEQLATIPVPVAPLKEQDEIVKRVETLFKKADEIEERYKKAKEYVDKLTQAILAKAFRGELVPQDPNDEPAEKLLERIREEREKQYKLKKN